MSAPTLDVVWAEVAESIEFIPEPYSAKLQPETTAYEMLRCDARAVDELVAAGLPYAERDGVRYFDPNDLYNLGMYSKTGKTQPELAFRMLFRFSTKPVEPLLEDKSWRFTVAFECPDCTGAAPWQFAGPTVEKFGGALAGVSGPDNSANTAEYSAIVTTTGAYTPLVAPALRELTQQYLQTGYRWQMIPVPMQADYDLVHRLGATSCIAASLSLAAQFTAAGYPAQAKRGWFCGVLGGVLDLPHAWVEVTDDDGTHKAVDIAKAQLAKRLSPDTGDFQNLCTGSVYNRIIPSAAAGNEPLARHDCGSPTPVHVRADIRKAN